LSIGGLLVVLLVTSVAPGSAMNTVPARAATAGASASWSSWGLLFRGIPLAQPPVATSMQPGRLDVFAVDQFGANWDFLYDNSGIGWRQYWLGSHTSAQLGAVTNPSFIGYIDVYERTTDTGHALSVSLLDQSHHPGQWTAWSTCIGGHLEGEPSGVMWNGSGHAFVEGTDQQLWEWIGVGQDLCGTWQPAIGGRLSAAPAAVGTGTNEDVVFVRGTDLALWYWSSLTGWHSAGGRLAGKPAAVAPGNGPPVAFVQGTDGALWSFDTGTGSWHLVGGQILGVPSPVVEPRGGVVPIDVFVEGVDHAVWHAHFDGTNWSWENLGGLVTSAPSAVSWGAGSLDVFARGADRLLWHIFYR
jgi:hypothetical protein